LTLADDLMSTRRSLRTKLEEVRQAKAIHGGALNLCAAALGVRLSRMPIPSRRLRLLLYRTVYGKRYAPLNEGELDRPLAEFTTLNALFTRAVRPEFRPIAESADQLLGPCDGRVQDAGHVHDSRILTVKGIEYTLQSLLPHVDTRQFEGGAFGIFFLSPTDCHRVFSPQDDEPPLRVGRGEWLGTFELGSTVILIAESAAGLVPLMRRDEIVRFGQPAFGPVPVPRNGARES
jgi:phosphatidylserine decarboxylase